MYVELHAFVRARLAEHYGPKVADANAITTAFTSRMLQVVDATKAIPAHLLGNMWAQSWGNLCVRLRVAAATHCNTLRMYNIIPGIVPFPSAPSPPDATPYMQQQHFTSRDVVRTAERFFRSLGMRELPPSFWNTSLFDEPPPPREAVCHASAWDFTDGVCDDVRLKMCVEITEEDLVTAHHELGHLYGCCAYRSVFL